jgi:hypothetical protein
MSSLSKRPFFGTAVGRPLSPGSVSRSPLPCERRERELAELVDENKSSSSPESESLKRDKGFRDTVPTLHVASPPIAGLPELKFKKARLYYHAYSLYNKKHCNSLVQYTILLLAKYGVSYSFYF